MGVSDMCGVERGGGGSDKMGVWGKLLSWWLGVTIGHSESVGV